MEAPTPLVRLMRGLKGVDQVITRGEALPDFDLHCPMMSLPAVMGTTMETIPADVPYLRADAGQAARGEPARRAGSAWTTGRAGMGRWLYKELSTDRAIGRRRSMSPALLAPLFDVPGVNFFSLQKEGTRAPAHFPLTDFTAEMIDFADTPR